MTDTAPQIMQSRQLATVDPPTMQTAAMARMDAEFRMAQAIARAGADMLPRAYRDKPGAVILVQQWANAHGVDILTAMQTVAFVQGRPVIDATMQRAMAERAGYDVEIIEADRTHAVVQVTPPGKTPRTATYTWEDATTAKLTNKDNWKNNPEDMLVARATTRALKRHAPSVMLGFVDPDDAGEPDMVEVLTPTGPTAPTATPTEVVDADIIEPSDGPSTPGEVAGTTPDAEPPGNAGPAGADSPGPSDTEPAADETPADVPPGPTLGDDFTSDELTAVLTARNIRQIDARKKALELAADMKIAEGDQPTTLAKIASADPLLRAKFADWVNGDAVAS